MKTLLVTGGAGFIGANFVLQAVADGMRVVNLDKLTYAGNLDTLEPLADNPLHVFVQGDIGDRELVGHLLAEHRPSAVVNFAAESHVESSIEGPGAFVQTNAVYTLELLESDCHDGMAVTLHLPLTTPDVLAPPLGSPLPNAVVK